MMTRNFELRQKSTGDVIVRLGTPEKVLSLFSSATYDRSCSDATRYSPRALGRGICVTWRVSIAVNKRGSRLRAGWSVLPVRHRMESTPPPRCPVRLPFLLNVALKDRLATG